MSQSLTFESHMPKPSWCFDVIVMYFAPAFLKSATHSAASNFSGLNCGGSFSYSLDRHLLDVHHPFAAAEHAVGAPMDEDAEPRVLKPLAGGEILRRRHVGRFVDRLGDDRLGFGLRAPLPQPSSPSNRPTTSPPTCHFASHRRTPRWNSKKHCNSAELDSANHSISQRRGSCK